MTPSDMATPVVEEVAAGTGTIDGATIRSFFCRLLERL
jgi:hypothetical protein